LNITSELKEVQNLRYPTNFEFGWKRNFAWQNSEAVLWNLLIPVKFFFHTTYGKISSEKFENPP
jgi:hypothetical protein